MKGPLAILSGAVFGAGVMLSNIGSSATPNARSLPASSPPADNGSIVLIQEVAPRTDVEAAARPTLDFSVVTTASTAAPVLPAYHLPQAEPVIQLTQLTATPVSVKPSAPPLVASTAPPLSTPAMPSTSVSTSAVSAIPAGTVVLPRVYQPTMTYVGESITPGCEEPAPCRRGGFYAGGGVYYFVPRWSDAPAFDVQSVTAGGGAPSSRSTSTTFLDEEPDFAPRAWFGYTSESGLGVRGSGWYFHTNSNQSTSFGPSTLNPNGSTTTTIATVPGLNRANDDIVGFGAPIDQGVFQMLSAAPGSGLTSTLEVSSRLEMMVFDLEVTQQWQSDLWTLLIAGGARYADIDQRYFARGLTPGAGGTVTEQTLSLGNVFRGVGPEMFLEGQRRLGGSGLSIYGNARAGLLFGRADLSAVQTSRVTGGVGDLSSESTTSNNVTRPFIEFEGGLEYRANFGAMTPFVRVGVVGQNWFDVGSPSSNATNRDGDLSLFGFTLTAGLNF